MTQRFAEKMMILQLRVSQWGARTNDDQVSAEVAKAHGSDVTMGAFQKDLVTRESLADLRASSTDIRLCVNSLTAPWLDNGQRILPRAHYFRTMELIKDKIHKREEKLGEFLGRWDEIQQDAKRRLNGLYDEDAYPTVEQLRHAFRVRIRVMPFPAGDDFRVPLGGDEEKAVRQQVDEQIRDMLGAAMLDVWQRVHDVVSHMAERLKAYDERMQRETAAGGKLPRSDKEGTFRDSLVDNIRDLVDLLPGLNLTEDPALTETMFRLRDELAKADPKDLREDDDLRHHVEAQADQILADIGGFLA